MKSKFFFISLFFLLSHIVSSAQGAFHTDNYTGATVYKLMDAANNNNKIYSGTTNTVELSEIKGSPYENDIFFFGKASDKLTKKIMNFYLRYNVYNDVIEMKTDYNDTKIVGLIKSLNNFAIINNKEYHYEIYSDDSNNISEGYFILKSKGEKSSLYLKKRKEFIEKLKGKDAFHRDVPASFKDSQKYYYKKGRVLHPLSTKKKELLIQLSEKSSELKKFIKTEKLNLKTEKDLVKLFKYYDSLIK